MLSIPYKNLLNRLFIELTLLGSSFSFLVSSKFSSVLISLISFFMLAKMPDFLSRSNMGDLRSLSKVSFPVVLGLSGSSRLFKNAIGFDLSIAIENTFA